MEEEKISENLKEGIGSIKSEINNTQVHTMQYVHKNLIMMYFRI